MVVGKAGVPRNWHEQNRRDNLKDKLLIVRQNRMRVRWTQRRHTVKMKSIRWRE